MNIHKNARLTLSRRIEMVRSIVDRGLRPAEAAAEAGVSEPTGRKWLGRYLAEGESGLRDRSSRPKRSPRTISPEKALVIAELRRRRLTQARIAQVRLSDLNPAEPIVRYGMSAPAISFTSIPRSSGGLSAWVSAFMAARDRRSRQDGNTCSLQSTTMPELPSPTCTPTRRKPARPNSYKTPLLISAPWECDLGASSRTTAHHSARKSSLKREANEKSGESMKAKGMKINDVSPQEIARMRDKAKPITEKFTKEGGEALAKEMHDDRSTRSGAVRSRDLCVCWCPLRRSHG